MPAGSGCGGMGCLRNIGSRFGADSGFVETMGSMTRDLPYWFADRMREYASGEACRLGREDELPFDSHFMAAAVAPRALLVLEGLDDMWTNPYGTAGWRLHRSTAFWEGTAHAPYVSGKAGMNLIKRTGA